LDDILRFDCNLRESTLEWDGSQRTTVSTYTAHKEQKEDR